MEIKHPLPYHFGRALKAELVAAQHLQAVAQAKATTAKLFSDAILKDAKHDLKDKEYRLHEDDETGTISLVVTGQGADLKPKTKT